MRIFVFAIGGTGSRVLNALIMQLAAGVKPKNQNGEVIDSIVPIIIDPHADNGGLQDLTSLMDNYRTIRKSIYGDLGTKSAEGFFAVKLETLKDVQPNVTKGDKFYFKLSNVSTNTFAKFIDDGSMSLENRYLTELLYSKEETDTHMKEGFYGSPNIGCVALYEFAKSDDFKAFCQAYNEGDKIFFIGSIFGGTGASGLPLFISSIRDLNNINNDSVSNKGACAESPIGALIVMPYFSIAHKDGSPIKENDWRIKSRSALSYYESNLNKFINDIYYIADPNGTESFKNDPGNINNQSDNKAHVVEFIGANAICNFISSDNVGHKVDDKGRTCALKTNCFQYGFATDEPLITFAGLSYQTLELIEKPMMSFHLLRHFMENDLLKNLGKPFACGYTPKIQKSVLSRELVAFFNYYDKWLNEMQSHGTTAHNLSLFNKYEPGKYTNLYHGIETKKGVFSRRNVEESDMKKKLNKYAEDMGNIPEKSQEYRWYIIASRAIDELITDNYELKIVGKL